MKNFKKNEPIMAGGSISGLGCYTGRNNGDNVFGSIMKNIGNEEFKYSFLEYLLLEKFGLNVDSKLKRKFQYLIQKNIIPEGRYINKNIRHYRGIHILFMYIIATLNDLHLCVTEDIFKLTKLESEKETIENLIYIILNIHSGRTPSFKYENINKKMRAAELVRVNLEIKDILDNEKE